MKREDLEKLGLSEEQIIGVMKLKSNELQELESLKVDLKVANQTITNLQKDVKERDTQLENLKNSKISADDLQNQINILQSQNQEKDINHAKEIADLKKGFAVDEALRNAKARNLTAVKALLTLDNLEFQDDGTIKGLSEQIEKLQNDEDSKFLFEDTKSTQKFKGAIPGESGNEEPEKNIDYSNMSYEEIAKAMENQQKN